MDTSDRPSSPMQRGALNAAGHCRSAFRTDASAMSGDPLFPYSTRRSDIRRRGRRVRASLHCGGRSPGRTLLWLLAWMFVGAAASLGRAQSSGLELEWSTDEPSCGSGEVVEAEVDRLLHGSTASARRLSVHVSLARDASSERDGFALVLAMSDNQGPIGNRTLHAPRCAELVDAAALLIALAVDPAAVAALAPTQSSVLLGENGRALDSPPTSSDADSTAHAGSGVSNPRTEATRNDRLGSPTLQISPSDAPLSSTEPTPWPTGAPASEAPASEAHAPEKVRSSSELRTIRWALEVGGLFELGTLPAPSGGLRGGASMTRHRFRLRLELLGLWPRSATLAGGPPGAEVRHWWFAGAVSTGLELPLGRFRIAPVALLEIGAMGGKSTQISNPSRARSAHVALGAALSAGVTIGTVVLGVEGDLRLPLLRPTFVVGGLGDSHQLPSVLGRVGLWLRYPAR